VQLKLNVQYRIGGQKKNKSLEFVNVIRAINGFAPTLTHLRLNRSGHDGESPDDSRTEEQATQEREEMIPFPKLKKFTVSPWDFGILRISDFIERSCPALQQLCLDENWNYRVGSEDVVKDKAELSRTFFGMGPKLSKIVFCGFTSTETMIVPRITLHRNDDDNANN